MTSAEKIAAINWYHTLELPDGVVTSGWFDTRPTRDTVPMPTSLEGKRCLDVGTWDGFWAFEMERRGAASVTAIDIDDQRRWDWPPHMRMNDGELDAGQAVLRAFKDEANGFRVAHEALGSKVERIDLSIYDLSPERLGMFDFVFIGTLLLHLRDPVQALAAMRTVVGGDAVIAENVDFGLSRLRPRTPTARLYGKDRPWWWIPNVAGLHTMVESAGFDIQRRTPLYFVPLGASHPKGDLGWRAAPRVLISAEKREALVNQRWGLPHAAVLARPRRS